MKVTHRNTELGPGTLFSVTDEASPSFGKFFYVGGYHGPTMVVCELTGKEPEFGELRRDFVQPEDIPNSDQIYVYEGILLNAKTVEFANSLLSLLVEAPNLHLRHYLVNNYFLNRKRIESGQIPVDKEEDTDLKFAGLYDPVLAYDTTDNPFFGKAKYFLENLGTPEERITIGISNFRKENIGLIDLGSCINDLVLGEERFQSAFQTLAAYGIQLEIEKLVEKPFRTRANGHTQSLVFYGYVATKKEDIMYGGNCEKRPFSTFAAAHNAVLEIEQTISEDSDAVI